MAFTRKRPTIYNVADRSGISISTISRVLNNPEMVNPETRSKVLAAIDELGFVPKAEARARALSSTNRIGVITPFFTAPSFVQRLRGVASGLAASNYELVIYTVDSSDRLQGYFSSIPYTGNLDGLIVISLPVRDIEVQRLIAHGIETVLIESSHPGLNCIKIDDFQGGQMAAQHLVERGHHRIAYIGNEEPHDLSIHPAGMRLRGWQQALQAAGVAVPAAYIRQVTNAPEYIIQAARELLSLPEPPTAIFAAADIQALSILKLARELEVRVPEQLAIVGFDDIDYAEYADLTTVRQHLDESGRLAVEILLARIADPNRPLQHVNLPLKFIQRQTS